MPSPYNHTPRLRTSSTTPGMPVEINGVRIAVDHWEMRPLGLRTDDGPVEVSLTFYAEFATEPTPQETLQQREAAELAAITAEWRAVRDRYAGLGGVQSVLDLHHPRRPFAVVQCDLCEAPNGVPDADYVWPCPTYTVLAAEPEQAELAEADPEGLELAAEPAPAPVAVTMHFHGPQSSDAINKQLLTEAWRLGRYTL